MNRKSYLKIWTAGRQHHFMSPQQLSLDCQGDVDEGLVVQQLIKHREQIALMIVPPQAESLRRHGFASKIRQISVNVR